MIQMLAPAFALFIYYAGVLIEKSEPNFTIGIRTPWTLSSESVWTKTHVLGAKLFKIAGGLALLGIVLPQLAIFFILIPLLLAAFIPVVYSYFEYQKEVKQI